MTEVPLLDGEQEAFLHAESPPLDTRPPDTHEVTVAEVREDTEQQLRGKISKCRHSQVFTIAQLEYYWNMFTAVLCFLSSSSYHCYERAQPLSLDPHCTAARCAGNNRSLVTGA